MVIVALLIMDDFCIGKLWGTWCVTNTTKGIGCTLRPDSPNPGVVLHRNEKYPSAALFKV
jgi:hypothetical protein